MDTDSQLSQVTPLVLTYNEELNLERTLQSLDWAHKIIIIDSYSTDKTLDIAQSYAQVKIYQRAFDTFADQCNFGLTHIQSEWVLSLDADYRLSPALIQHLTALIQNPDVDGYTIPFVYCVLGQPLRGTLLPPRTALYRRNKAHYQNDGHAHRVNIQGHCEFVQYPIYHDDRKPLSRWLWSQDRYLLIEADKLKTTPWPELSWGDRIRKQKILAPFIILVYCLLLKGGIWDGWRGWYYAFQRVLAEILLSIRLIENDWE